MTPVVRRRLIWVAAVAVLLAVLGGGVVLARKLSDSADRTEALRLAAGDPEKALPALNRCLERSPDDPELLAATVRAFIRSDATPFVVEPLAERWGRLKPNDVEPARVLLEIRYKLKRRDEAIASAQRVLQLAPEDDQVRWLLVTMLNTVGRYGEARRECRPLLDHGKFPREDTLVMLAGIEASARNLPEAARLLAEVSVVSPEHPGLLLNRGIVHHLAGEHEQAVVTLRRAKPRDMGDRVQLLYHLGLSLARTGRAEESKKVFDELTRVQNAHQFSQDAQVQPDDLGRQVRAGRALLDAGEFEQARQVLENAVGRLDPDRAALTALADCYDRLGQPGRARETRTLASRLP